VLFVSPSPVLPMPQATKRLDFLLKMTSPGGPGSEDPFVWYGLAMEYRGLERTDEALATFEELRRKAPDYVPMYLMCGQMLESMSRPADARAWLSAGIEAARRKGDSHAASELESALQAL
jgi:predicted Zn-dependent protease